jgi:type IV pilus assembly protein PilC
MTTQKQSPRMSQKAAAILLRQLAIGARGGLPLAEVIGTLGDKSEWLEPATVARLEQSLLTQPSLAAALATLPGLFPAHVVELIKAGEERDQLPLVLDTLAREYAFASFDTGVLTWPLALCTTLLVVLALVVIFVIPQFEELFKGFGADLPPLTQLVIDASRFVMKSGWFIAALAALLLVAHRRGWIPPRLRLAVQQAISSFPGLRAYRVNRFSLQLALWLEAGRRQPALLQPALRHLEAAAQQLWLARCAQQLGARLSQGQKVHEALDALPLLPRYVFLFSRLADRLPDPAPALEQLMEMALENHAYARDRFTRHLIFWSYMFIGVAVAVSIVALYLPIFKMGSVV